MSQPHFDQINLEQYHALDLEKITNPYASSKLDPQVFFTARHYKWDNFMSQARAQGFNDQAITICDNPTPDYFHVILPVFNNERWISALVDSLCAQTYQGKMHYVFVDDGSTDNSLEVIHKQATRLHEVAQVTILTHTNIGVSGTRNHGLHGVMDFIATKLGFAQVDLRRHWLFFIDTDDWISENYFANHAQLIQADSQLFMPMARIIHYYQNSDSYKDLKLDIPDANFISGQEFPLFNNFNYTRVAARSGYRLDVVFGKQLMFPEGIHYGEDLVFNWLYTVIIHQQLPQSRAKIDYNTYYYYRREHQPSLSSQYESNLTSNINLERDIHYLHCFNNFLEHIRSYNPNFVLRSFLLGQYIYLSGRLFNEALRITPGESLYFNVTPEAKILYVPQHRPEFKRCLPYIVSLINFMSRSDAMLRFYQNSPLATSINLLIYGMMYVLFPQRITETGLHAEMATDNSRFVSSQYTTAPQLIQAARNQLLKFNLFPSMQQLDPSFKMLIHCQSETRDNSMLRIALATPNRHLLRYIRWGLRFVGLGNHLVHKLKGNSYNRVMTFNRANQTYERLYHLDVQCNDSLRNIQAAAIVELLDDYDVGKVSLSTLPESFPVIVFVDYQGYSDARLVAQAQELCQQYRQLALLHLDVTHLEQMSPEQLFAQSLLPTDLRHQNMSWRTKGLNLALNYLLSQEGIGFNWVVRLNSNCIFYPEMFQRSLRMASTIQHNMRILSLSNFTYFYDRPTGKIYITDYTERGDVNIFQRECGYFRDAERTINGKCPAGFLNHWRFKYFSEVAFNANYLQTAPRRHNLCGLVSFNAQLPHYRQYMPEADLYELSLMQKHFTDHDIMQDFLDFKPEIYFNAEEGGWLHSLTQQF